MAPEDQACKRPRYRSDLSGTSFQLASCIQCRSSGTSWTLAGRCSLVSSPIMQPQMAAALLGCSRVGLLVGWPVLSRCTRGTKLASGAHATKLIQSCAPRRLSTLFQRPITSGAITAARTVCSMAATEHAAPTNRFLTCTSNWLCNAPMHAH